MNNVIEKLIAPVAHNVTAISLLMKFSESCQQPLDGVASDV